MLSRLRAAALFIVVLAIGAAGGVFWASSRPVEEDPGATWPEETSVPLDLTRPTLVLFVHPHSPGAQQALDEVARLEKKFDGRVAVSVRVYRGNGAMPGWEKEAVWQKAGQVSSDVAADPTGDVARQFGVAPAETAVVYAPSGRLMYRGSVVPRSKRAAAAASHLIHLLESWRRLESRPVVGVTTSVKS